MKPTFRHWRGRIYAEWPVGHVYFAAMNRFDDVIKVGWSQNPWSRVVELGFELKEKIRVLRTIDIHRGSPLWGVGYFGLEQQAHRLLLRRRVNPWTLEITDRGEWYRWAVAEVDDLVNNVRFSLMESGDRESA
jgi:hypothetical protein